VSYSLLKVEGSKGLLSAAQMNTVKFHPWNVGEEKIHRPTASPLT